MFPILAGIISAAGAIVGGLSKLGLAIGALKAIGNIIGAFAKALGLVKPDRDVEDLGDRAMQAEQQGLTPDKFDSYKDWVKKIEGDDWGYDPEKTKDVDAKEKINKGIEVSSAVSMDEFPGLPIEAFFGLVGKNLDIFSESRMKEFANVAKTDSDLFSKIIGYMTGSIKDHNVINSVTDKLMEIEKRLDATMNDDRAYDKASSFYSRK